MVRRNSRQPLSIFLRFGEAHSHEVDKHILERGLAFLKVYDAGLVGGQRRDDSADRFVRFENDFELRLAVSGSMNHLAYARKLAKTREVTIQRADFEMKYRFIAQTSLECSRRIALQHAASVDDRDAVAKVVG